MSSGISDCKGVFAMHVGRSAIAAIQFSPSLPLSQGSSVPPCVVIISLAGCAVVSCLGVLHTSMLLVTFFS